MHEAADPQFDYDIDILKLYVTRSEDTFCYRDIKFDSFDISHVKVGYLWYLEE